MKGDFSRGAAARPGVTRVLMQQGRVQLDDDWNTAAATADRRVRIALADLLGAAEPFGVAAVPRDAAGYGIAVRAGYRFDGHGTHLHVDGVPTFGGHEPFAVEATVAPRAGGRGGTVVARFAHEHHRGAHGEFALRVDAHGRLTFLRVEDERRVRALTATIAVPFGAHTDVAAVCDGRRMNLYVGGRFAGSREAGHGRIDRDVAFMVGAHAGGDHVADPFDGAIESLTISACAHHHHHRRRHHECPPAIFTLDDAHAHRGERPPKALKRRVVVGAGRAYVGGMLCENAAEFDLDPARAAGSGKLLAYLEVWERLVTAAEDPALEDPALGGIDTAAHVRTEARVRVAPLEHAAALWDDAIARGTLALRLAPGATPLGNQLARVEVHRAGYADEKTFAFDDERFPACTVAGNTVTCDRAAAWLPGQPLRLVSATGDAVLTHVVRSGAEPHAYEVTGKLSSGPFRAVPLATVKWSLDNASNAFALPSAKDATDRLVLDDPAGRVAMLQENSVVEIVDGAAVQDGGAGTLTRVTGVVADAPGSTTVILRDAVGPLAENGVLRSWSAFASEPYEEAVVTSGEPLFLADGFTATFGAGRYVAGDFWWTALRVDVDTLWDWPSAPGGEPRAVAPFGVDRRYAPLALIEPHGGRLATVTDLRRIIDPLADDGGDPFEPQAERPAPEHLRGLERELEFEVEREREFETEVERELEREVERELEHEHEHHREPWFADEHAVVLMPSEHAPHGYRFAGMTVVQRPRSPAWGRVGDAPGVGPALAATLDGRLYAFYESGGELWSRSAHEDDEPWERCAARSVFRDGGALVVLGGALYAVGGLDERGRPSARCDAYDPSADTWVEVAAMRTARAFFGAAAVDGRLVALGGLRRMDLFGLFYASVRVESWLPGEPSWRRERALPERRQGCAAVSRGRRVYLVGGAAGRFWAGKRRYGACVDVVAPFEGQTWSRGPLAEAQRDARVVLVDDALVVVGGRTHGDGFAPAERYPLWADCGDPLPQLDRLAPGLAVVDGAVYAIAGLSAMDETAEIARCELATPLFVHRREHRGA